MKSTIRKSRFSYPLIVIKEVTKTDFTLRYNDSALGYVWSVLKPLALFSILYLVFSKIFKVGDQIPHYAVYLLAGIVLWNFFAEITNGGVTAVVEKGDLMRKINFPRFTIIIAKAISAGINLLINFLVIFVFMIFSGAQPSWWALVVVPLLLVELFVFGVAVSFVLGTLFVRLRDLSYIWEVVMQGLFYATPLLYPIDLVVHHVSPTVAKIMLLNPIAQIVQDLRHVLVTPQALSFNELYRNQVWRLVPIAIVLIVLFAGVAYFRRREASFAEEV